MMTMYCKNGVQIDCTPLNTLGDGYILVYAQERLAVAVDKGQNECDEVESMDIMPFIQGYIMPDIDESDKLILNS